MAFNGDMTWSVEGFNTSGMIPMQLRQHNFQISSRTKRLPVYKRAHRFNHFIRKEMLRIGDTYGCAFGRALDRVSFTRKHLMDQSCSLGKAHSAVRSGWSDKFCNAEDEQNRSTEGLFFALSGLRYVFFVVVKSPTTLGRKSCLASKREKPVKWFRVKKTRSKPIVGNHAANNQRHEKTRYSFQDWFQIMFSLNLCFSL